MSNYFYNKRTHDGYTRGSLRIFRKWLAKGITIQRIRYKKGGNWQRSTIIYATLPCGKQGKIRLLGFNTGYSGEGPRGMETMLQESGFMVPPLMMKHYSIFGEENFTYEFQKA